MLSTFLNPVRQVRSYLSLSPEAKAAAREAAERVEFCLPWTSVG
jgi:hypothetical protein